MTLSILQRLRASGCTGTQSRNRKRLKQENPRCLEWGEDEYHERQHSGQEREQPVAIVATYLVQFARELYSHRRCSDREASTDLYKGLCLTGAAPFAVDSPESQCVVTDKIDLEEARCGLEQRTPPLGRARAASAGPSPVQNGGSFWTPGFYTRTIIRLKGTGGAYGFLVDRPQHDPPLSCVLSRSSKTRQRQVRPRLWGHCGFSLGGLG